jgi:hypothetical protein
MGTEEDDRLGLEYELWKTRKVDELDTATVDDLVEVRVLAHDLAKVTPHAADNLLPSRCVEVRHRPTQVLVRAG